MKKFIIITLLLAFAATSFGQQTEPLAAKPTIDYLQKSKHQKTAAWILTGAGTLGLLFTLTADAGQLTGGAFVTIFSLGTVEPEYKSLAVPYLLSGACLAGGITLFVASSRNKRKARDASVFINMEKAPVVKQGVFINRSFPALGIKIGL